MKVAGAYGMIHPGADDTSAVRATFIIDPEGTLRAMVYYPMTNGRSIPEFLRLVKALQTLNSHGVATPEGWRPGEQVIVPPPATTDAAEARATPFVLSPQAGPVNILFFQCRALRIITDLNTMTRSWGYKSLIFSSGRGISAIIGRCVTPQAAKIPGI
jgi:hypothetical protein